MDNSAISIGDLDHEERRFVIRAFVRGVGAHDELTRLGSTNGRVSYEDVLGALNLSTWPRSEATEVELAWNSEPLCHARFPRLRTYSVFWCLTTDLQLWIGKTPLKGRRLTALKLLVDHPGLSWTTAAVAWYNGTTRTVELTSQTAVWYRSGKPPVPLRWVLVRDPQGEFATQALLCTDLAVDPAQILEWFVLRWQLEVTFQEVRAHLGVETQRQWSDHAIARTTPILMGLFSWTTLAAHLMQEQRPLSHRTAAWYAKPSPTFVDAIALVRRHLWLASEGFSLSDAEPDIWKVPAALYHRLVDSLAYAA